MLYFFVWFGEDSAQCTPEETRFDAGNVCFKLALYGVQWITPLAATRALSGNKQVLPGASDQIGSADPQADTDCTLARGWAQGCTEFENKWNNVSSAATVLTWTTNQGQFLLFPPDCVCRQLVSTLQKRCPSTVNSALCRGQLACP